MLKTYLALLRESEKHIPLGLGIIISTRGSTPQVPGASALFSSSGLLQGTLGGGPVEAEVMQEAAACISKKEVRLKEFTLEGRAGEEESPCGGRAVILIDGRPEHINVFSALAESLKNREPGVLATYIKGKEKLFVTRRWVSQQEIFGSGEPAHSGLKGEIKKAYESGSPVLWSKEKEPVFLEPLFPKFRLVIAGAGHVGRAVARQGHWLDFEVTVIDDRAEFADPERIPEADRVITGDIPGSIEKEKLDRDAYVVIVTPGHQYDAQVLRKCIGSRAGYIGMMGSRRKVKQMRRDFIQKGWSTSEQFDKVHTPIGMKIGSQTVEEIAVSIAAELVAVRNKKSPKEISV